ncbi:PH domain-containing protein [Alteromonas ponticola]|uniref:PH domain-containing protein n=1 Tax=Alteromonas aquimaris TaxID=2998417 RepID=A0ABT3PA18_9ALTE|nr:PH domain-containing protein [Alteromonas aquimaris]MCW8109632.1 PH domain-containing protein [Alteromonas aquimaris]
MEMDNFSNLPVRPSELPDVREVAMTPVSPRYRIANLASVVSVFIILCLALTIAHLQPWVMLPQQLHKLFPYAVAVLALIATLLFSYHWFADPLVRYAIRQQDLILQKGLIFRTITCQPILRVQHIEIKRGPLDRLAGLAKLQVFSAGGSAYTFEIPGLSVERAVQLRQFILDHKDLDAR